MLVQFPNKPSIVVSGKAAANARCSSRLHILSKSSPASFYITGKVDAIDAYHTTKLPVLLASGKIQFIVTVPTRRATKTESLGDYERNEFKRGDSKVPAGGTKLKWQLPPQLH
jgi:hypothetical protein